MLHPIHHKYETGRIFYTADGITVAPFLTNHTLTIPWTNISFISPTPAVKMTDNGWQTFDGHDLMAADALKQLDFFHIDVVMKNRHLPVMRSGFLQHLLFYMNAPEVSATYTAGEVPHEMEGCITYKVRKRTLNCPLKELLDLFQAYSRYDLLCHGV